MAQPTDAAQSPTLEPWEQLDRAIDARDGDGLVALLHDLPPEETAYTIAHLDPDRRSRMLALLATAAPDLGADLMEHFDDGHAADMIEVLPAPVAAALIDEMDSDEQADVLGDIAPETAEAILDEMSPEEAEDVRQLLEYGDDTAGGLMITEYLVYPADQDVKLVRKDLRDHAEKYDEYEVRYLYAVDADERLVGAVPMRNLVMAQPGQPLSSAAMQADLVTVHVHDELEDVEDLFDRIDLMAVPVLDDGGRLAGVVRRAAVQEAVGEQARESLAKFGGILGGEELRSMPLRDRAVRRLMFLVPIMGLLLVSATIIAMFEDTVKRLPILAAFLPVVAGICGSGGGQAVAVSMREVSLGLIKPGDFGMVLMKEAGVAVVNGLLLGGMLLLVAWLWRGDLMLAVALGMAIPMVLLVAKCVGGTVPVLLRGLGVDPAMASGPTVTTVVDLVGFFTVLLLAELLVV